MDDFDFDGGDLPETPASGNANVGHFSSGSQMKSSAHGHYADEIASETLQAKLRTFYIDLKQSGNGKFVKISEKSRGKKTTIMMDAEDVEPFIEALQRIKSKI